MKKSLWFWLCFVTAVVLAVYFATRITMTTMGRGNAAIIRSISISTTPRSKSLSAIAAATGIAPGTRTYATSLDAINARLTRLPDVKTSAVRRMPNGNLTIRVQMHQAIAVWTDGESFYPLSADGTIISRIIEEKPANSVVFRGKLPDDVSEIVKLANGITDQLDYMEWIENRRWDINTTDGIKIMLPEENPSAAFSALMILNKNHNILSKKIQLLDMRDTARILVK